MEIFQHIKIYFTSLHGYKQNKQVSSGALHELTFQDDMGILSI